MAKNTREIQKIMEITITYYDPAKDIWQFHVKTGSVKTGYKEQEQVCESGWFKRIMTDISSLKSSIELLDDSIKPLRDAVEKKDMEALHKIVNNITMPSSKNKTTNPNKLFREKLKNSTAFTNHLNQSVDTMKKQTTSNDIIQKIAIAFVFTKISFEDIEKNVKVKSKFFKKIPMTDFPDLSEMQSQKTAQWTRTVESVFNMVTTFGSLAGMFPH